MLITTSQYNTTVESNAKRYGYKAANLMAVQQLLTEFSSNLANPEFQSIRSEIPDIFPVGGDLIIQHLNQYLPTWQVLFNTFRECYQAQSDYPKETNNTIEANLPPIGEAASNALQTLQTSIEACFVAHPIGQEMLEKFIQDAKLDKNDIVMVRSTGVNEDRADQSLAGSNLSAPSKADSKEISMHIGEVVASYFSYTSLSQRLSVGDTTFLTLPEVLPVLVQKLAGEKIQADHTNNKGFVYSMVIYSHGTKNATGATSLQIAPSHGAYVVNSQGPADDYYISSDGIVHAAIATNKTQRIIAKFNEETGRMELAWAPNPRGLHAKPSLDAQTALYIHRLACFLEQRYGMPLDIEAVWDPDRNIVSIVQVRALSAENQALLEPRAVNPKILSTIDSKKAQQVITPDLTRAFLILYPEQLCSADTTINVALTNHPVNRQKLQQLGDKTAQQAVIVSKKALNTSHEAGQFNNYHIPVLCLQSADIVAINTLLEQGTPLIVDPQHAAIYIVPSQYVATISTMMKEGKTVAECEAYLCEEKVLVNGIYASALNPHVTTQSYSFKSIDEDKKPSSNNILELLGNQKLGELIQEAQSANPEVARNATNCLFSIAYSALAAGMKANPEKPRSQQAVDKAHILLQSLEQLSTPQLDSSANNKACKEALGYILRAIVKAYKQGKISPALFKQVILQGAGVAVMLARMEKLHESHTDVSDKLLTEYLDIVKKFRGLITADFEADLLVTSVVTELAEKNRRETERRKEVKRLLSEILETPTRSSLVIEKKYLEYFYEATKLANYLIDPEKRKWWITFCVDACRTPEKMDALIKLVDYIASNRVHAAWINLVFTKTYEENQQDFTKTMEALSPDRSRLAKSSEESTSLLQKIEQAKEKIAILRAKIPLWAHPVQFNALYEGPEGFHQTLQEILLLLQWKENASLLDKLMLAEVRNQLIDVVDLIAKSLQTSMQYKDKNLQARRFTTFVCDDFYSLMKQFVTEAQYPETRSLFNALDSFMSNRKAFSNPNELNLNPHLDIRGATIGTGGLFQESATTRTTALVRGMGFMRNFLDCSPTIANLHALLHQNAIIANTKLHDISSIKKQLPPLLQELDKKLYKFNLASSVIAMADQTVYIEYNIPLHNHSSKVHLTYNFKTGNIYLRYSLYGDPRRRWEDIALMVNTCLALYDFSAIQSPQFNNAAGTMVLEVAIRNSSDVKAMYELISASNDMSFGNYGEMEELIKERIKIKLQSPNAHADEKLIDTLLNKYVPDSEDVQLLFIKVFIQSAREPKLKILLNSRFASYFIKTLFNANFIEQTPPPLLDFYKSTLATIKNNVVDFLKLIPSQYIKQIFKLANSNNIELRSIWNNLLQKIQEDPIAFLVELSDLTQTRCIEAFFDPKNAGHTALQAVPQKLLLIWQQDPIGFLNKFSDTAQYILIKNLFKLQTGVLKDILDIIQKDPVNFLIKFPETVQQSWIRNIFKLQSSEKTNFQAVLNSILDTVQKDPVNFLIKFPETVQQNWIDNIFDLQQSKNPKLQAVLNSILDTVQKDPVNFLIKFPETVQQSWIRNIFKLQSSEKTNFQAVLNSILDTVQKDPVNFLIKFPETVQQSWIRNIFKLQSSEETNFQAVLNSILDIIQKDPVNFLIKFPETVQQSWIHNVFKLQSSEETNFQAVFDSILDIIQKDPVNFLIKFPETVQASWIAQINNALPKSSNNKKTRNMLASIMIDLIPTANEGVTSSNLPMPPILYLKKIANYLPESDKEKLEKKLSKSPYTS